MSARKASSHKSKGGKPRSQHEKGMRFPRTLIEGGAWPLFVPIIILLLLALDYMWVTEDAFITFQSVENFWAGYGPNFNRGLRVESFSHPLWFMILSGLRVFGSDLLPPLSAVTGILLTVGGLCLAIEAARERLSIREGLFPLGALVVAVLPPFWQFASSGLETGLTFFWIGFIAWSVGKMSREPAVWERPIYLVLGLAPIIRPDLVVLVLPMVVAAMMLSASSRRTFSWKSFVPLLGLCILPGLVWQIFRMGYYGALFPNTYIAKEGLGSRWDQGFTYLIDLMKPYWLLPVLAVVIGLTIANVVRGGQKEKKNSRGIVIALLLGALLHGAMVCRSGGDFMHARLLLPALFAIATAGAVVHIPWSGRLKRICIGLVVLWSGYVCLCARPPYSSHISEDGIADERQWYVKRSCSARPITLKDYEFHSFYRVGEAATIMARKVGIKAIYWAHIGIAVGVIPDDITIIDPLALNDHLGSRIELTKRGRPGHEKVVPAAWFNARYPSPGGLVVTNQLNGEFLKKETPERVEAAKAVLSSPPLVELQEAVSAPLSVELFVRNILRSWRLTFMRIPSDPQRALDRYPPRSQ